MLSEPRHDTGTHQLCSALSSKCDKPRHKRMALYFVLYQQQSEVFIPRELNIQALYIQQTSRHELRLTQMLLSSELRLCHEDWSCLCGLEARVPGYRS
jgi:hypothetical protein